MKFLEQIAQTGPKDIYELIALTTDGEIAAEFFVRELQEKDRKILLLSRLLHQELGNGLWDQYAQDVLNNQFPTIPTPPGKVLPLKPRQWPNDFPF